MKIEVVARLLRNLVNETKEETIQSIRDDMAAMEARLNERIDGVRAELQAPLAEIPQTDMLGKPLRRERADRSHGIPQPNELEKPLLHALAELGGRAHRFEVERVVARNLRIPPAQAATKHGGVSSGDDTELQYRLSWAGTALVKRGLMRKDGRGTWSLVDQ